MSWGEMKRVVNSTVGTANFKALDELYKDSRYVYANDNVLLEFPVDRSQGTIPEAKIGIQGTYKVKLIFSARTRGGTFTGTVKKNGSTVANLQCVLSTTEDTECYTYVTVKKDDVVTIEKTGSDVTFLSANSISLCGMIGTGGVPASLIE